MTPPNGYRKRATSDDRSNGHSTAPGEGVDIEDNPFR